ncbi:uncharacterized protein [Lolium perenne]|uniref:uncharacterized protein n=1 Tax=Lolium perenne TaxID=4522 RepID=UPI003A98D89D
MGYYLADGIYLDWATFAKIMREPGNRAEAEFAKAQEAARKDIERAFGVLQTGFAIVRGPAQFWDMDTLSDIMTTCMLLLMGTSREDDTAAQGVDGLMNVDYNEGDILCITIPEDPT